MASLLDHLRAQADSEVQRIEERVREVFGRFEPLDRADAVGRFEAFFARYPKRRATPGDAALHEAGHFVIYEACGLYANEAIIFGTPFGRGGWGGEAGYYFPLGQVRPKDYDAKEFQRSAQVTLAGPLAEDLLGGRSVHSNIGELFEARFLVQRAAEISNSDKIKTWREVVLCTGALVERHTYDIRDVAERLERRKRIHRLQPSILKIVQRMQPAPIDLMAVSDRAVDVFQKIEDAIKELAR